MKSKTSFSRTSTFRTQYVVHLRWNKKMIDWCCFSLSLSLFYSSIAKHVSHTLSAIVLHYCTHFSMLLRNTKIIHTQSLGSIALTLFVWRGLLLLATKVESRCCRHLHFFMIYNVSAIFEPTWSLLNAYFACSGQNFNQNDFEFRNLSRKFRSFWIWPDLKILAH